MMTIKLFACLGLWIYPHFIEDDQASSPDHNPASKPNIILIYADDQAQWSLGVSGNSQAFTPNLDRLAREGAYLENAFVTTPVCSPARASLMTGQYASEYGIYDFIAPPGHILYRPDVATGLDPKSITFPEVLADAGYVNGLVGKWHLGDWTENSDKKYHPSNHGFHYFMGLTGGGTTPLNPVLESNGIVRPFEGLTDDILTDHALKFIEVNKDRLFMLEIAYRAPHSKWLPVADKDWEPYANLDPALPDPDFPDLDVKKVKTMMREYLASVSGVDRNIGRLLDLLGKLGLDEKTIIIFTSDHGYNMGHNGIWHKGNGIWATKSLPASSENIDNKYRPNLYDQSLRVPAIVRWPGVMTPGIIIGEMVSNLDWFPTIAEMTGAKIPAGKILRGRSIVPLLKGHKVDDWDNDFYAEYSMTNYYRAFMRSYRTQEWKLVMDFLNPERNELYHLVSDPTERHNLFAHESGRTARIKSELHEKIVQKMRSIEDPLYHEIAKPKWKQ